MYMFLKSVLRSIAALTVETGSREQSPKVDANFDLVNMWIMTLHEQWAERTLFVTGTARVGYVSQRCTGR